MCGSYRFHPRGLKFGMEVKCVCVCLWLCQLATGGVAVGVASFEKVHNFQMDSQTCTRFSGKVDHEPKDRLNVHN